jgi:hypothetical protein
MSTAPEAPFLAQGAPGGVTGGLDEPFRAEIVPKRDHQREIVSRLRQRALPVAGYRPTPAAA